MAAHPGPSEIADHLGLDLDHVTEAMATNGCFAPASLDQPLPVPTAPAPRRRPTCWARTTPPRRQPRHAPRSAPVVRRLRERDRRILYLRFFEERTQQEIADDIGVTQMQVSRLLSRIMRDLRTDLADDPAPADDDRLTAVG